MGEPLAAAAAAILLAGTAVLVVGVHSRPELNGRWGTVQTFDGQRYTVQMEDQEQPISLRPENVATEAEVSVCKAVDISSFPHGQQVATSMTTDSIGAVKPLGFDATNLSAEQQSAMSSWDAAFREVGFARVVGHGVSPALIAELRAAARAFFARPASYKMSFYRPLKGVKTKLEATGSYAPLWAGRASGAHDDPLEGYTFHRPQDGWERLSEASDPGHHPAELLDVAQRYAAALEGIMHRLHRLSAAALGLPPTFFDSPPGASPTSLLVISHYPPLDDPEIGEREPTKPRYRAHSDYTGFTILLQDEADHGGPPLAAAGPPATSEPSSERAGHERADGAGADGGVGGGAARASSASAAAKSRGGAARRGGNGGGSPGTATRTFRICRAPEGAGVGTFGAPFFGRAGATRPPPRPPSRAARAFSPPPLFIARPRRATPRVLPLRRSALLLFGKDATVIKSLDDSTSASKHVIKCRR